VGVNEYFTSPNALRKLGDSSELRIFGEPIGKLFHCKLYIFRFPNVSLCWVGSANLTKSAFTENLETVVEFEDIEAKASSYFLTIWDSNEVRSLDHFDIADYELKKKERWPDPTGQWTNIPEKDDEPVTPEPTPSQTGDNTLADPLSGWQTHLYKMQHTGHDLESWVKALDAGVEFVSRDWSTDFSDREVAIMFGQDYQGESFESFTPFGNLAKIHNVFGRNFCGTSLGAVKNRKRIGQEINEVRKLQSFSVDIAKKAFENLKNIDGCGNALTTRLLVFARPEWFVVANTKTFRGLKKMFGMPVNVNLQAGQYANLIEKICQQPWSKSMPPLDPAELRLWKYRAALLDPILYDGKVGEPVEV
jgi:hypothetical protein